jgi:undecaprenyl-diphosphatase
MLEYFKQLDIHLFTFINSHHNVFFDQFFLVISQLGNGWIAVPLVAAIIIAITPRKFLGRALAYAAVAGLLAGVANTQIKRAVHRPRPVVYFERLDQSGTNPSGSKQEVHIVGKSLRQNSFPSGHAATAFAAAAILALLYGGYCFAGFVPALLVAYSRMYMGVHFPLDVCGGAALGFSAAVLVLFIFRLKWLPLLPIRRHNA